MTWSELYNQHSSDYTPSKYMRNKQQIIWDYFALLRLFKAVNSISHIDGNLKVQKLSFITELYGINDGVAAMHVKFFRYTHGPYSKDLAKDVDSLIEAEILTTTKRLTKKGDYIIDYLTSEARQTDVTNTALGAIDQVALEFGKHSGLKLKEMVYKMTVPVHDLSGALMKVRDIDVFTDILVPTENAELRNPSSLVNDTIIEAIENEINLPLECLDPATKDYQKTVNSALQRIQETSK